MNREYVDNKLNNMDQNDKEMLIGHEIKIKNLESLVSILPTIRDTLLRLETRLADTNFQSHEMRLKSLEDNNKEVSVALNKLNTFKTQFVVYGVIFVFIINLVVPRIIEKLMDNAQPTITHITK